MESQKTQSEGQIPPQKIDPAMQSCRKKKSESATFLEDVRDHIDEFIHASMDEHKTCFQKTIKKVGCCWTFNSFSLFLFLLPCGGRGPSVWSFLKMLYFLCFRCLECQRLLLRDHQDQRPKRLKACCHFKQVCPNIFIVEMFSFCENWILSCQKQASLCWKMNEKTKL